MPKQKQPGILLPVKCPFQQTCSQQLSGRKKRSKIREKQLSVTLCFYYLSNTHPHYVVWKSVISISGKGQSVHNRDHDNSYPSGKGGNWIHVQSKPDFQARELCCAEGMKLIGSSKPSPAPLGQHWSSTVMPATQMTWQSGHC